MEDYTYMTRYKDDIIELFCPAQGNTVIDVGAHTGLYTILGSRYVGSSGKIISIEPHPENFEILKRNINLNGITNVIALEYAAYSHNRSIKLYLPEEQSGYTIYNTLMANRANYQDRYLMVDARTLDELLKILSVNAKDINWIKIDVEGAELEVLRGASNILMESKNIFLLVEIHSNDLYKQVVELIRIYNLKIKFEKWNKEIGWGHVLFHKVL
jgi:FkbM family methyltransferase